MIDNIFILLPICLFWALVAYAAIFILVEATIELYKKRNPPAKYWYNGETKEIGVELENGIIEPLGTVEEKSPE